MTATADLFSAPRAENHSATNGNGELPYQLPLELIIDDRDIIRALVEYPEGDERNQYAVEAMKIGILALRHVGGQVSADQIMKDVQQLLQQHTQLMHGRLTDTLVEYFHPDSGRFNERVQRLVGQDGELSLLIKGLVDGENSLIAKTLMSHVGSDSSLMKLLDPQQSEGLLSMLRQIVDSQLTQQRNHLLSEFSLDNKDGSLTRLVKELTTNHGDLSNDMKKKIDEVVKEFSLNEPNSALSRLVQNVTRAQTTITSEFSLDSETSCLSRLKRELTTMLEAQVKSNADFQTEVKGALRELTARREEQSRSTIHGGTFQSAVFDFLHRQSEKQGDVAEFTADQVGAVKNRKWGDVVVELGCDTVAPGARIVFEAKEEQGYTLKTALAEIENARKNRLAQVGVFVYSKKTAPSELQSLKKFGNDIIAVWDLEDTSSDAFLIAALELARGMCFYTQRQRDSQAADFDSIETAMQNIEKYAANLDEIRKSTVTIQNASENILKRVRIDREALDEQVAILREKIGDLRALASPSQ